MPNPRSELDLSAFTRGEEAYFDEERSANRRSFDVRLLHEPVTVLTTKSPVILSEDASTSDAMRAMQAKHTGCVLVTDDLGGIGRAPPELVELRTVLEAEEHATSRADGDLRGLAEQARRQIAVLVVGRAHAASAPSTGAPQPMIAR